MVSLTCVRSAVAEGHLLHRFVRPHHPPPISGDKPCHWDCSTDAVPAIASPNPPRSLEGNALYSVDHRWRTSATRSMICRDRDPGHGLVRRAEISGRRQSQLASSAMAFERHSITKILGLAESTSPPSRARAETKLSKSGTGETLIDTNVPGRRSPRWRDGSRYLSNRYLVVRGRAGLPT